MTERSVGKSAAAAGKTPALGNRAHGRAAGSPATDGEVLSVTGLNRLARTLLESSFPLVTVEGEISNLATPRSGHWYLTLKDSSSSIRCAMFVNRNRLVRFTPRNGMQIIVRGKLSIYESRGDYQLIAESMEEAGDGALRRAFDRLKAKLQSEGLFDPAAKQQLRSEYAHVGVITSMSGAALRDVLAVFRRRFPHTRITLLPVPVQGAEAPEAIVRAIELANRHRHKLALQALIIGRGGGSLEDLQAFNEETVARAIFASELPITSAVGHETDFSIADFVADLRAPTPSAAAELMSPDQQDYREALEDCSARLAGVIKRRLDHAQQVLDLVAGRLQRPQRRLQDHAQSLDRLESRMLRAIRNRLALHQGALQTQRRALVASSPQHLIKESGLLLENHARRLQQALRGTLEAHRARLGELGRGLAAVSPLQTLARGYSITCDESAQVIRRADDVKKGSRIVSRLARGRLTSTVDSVCGDED